MAFLTSSQTYYEVFPNKTLLITNDITFEDTKENSEAVCRRRTVNILETHLLNMDFRWKGGLDII